MRVHILSFLLLQSLVFTGLYSQSINYRIVIHSVYTAYPESGDNNGPDVTWRIRGRINTGINGNTMAFEWDGHKRNMTGTPRWIQDVDYARGPRPNDLPEAWDDITVNPSENEVVNLSSPNIGVSFDLLEAWEEDKRNWWDYDTQGAGNDDDGLQGLHLHGNDGQARNGENNTPYRFEVRPPGGHIQNFKASFDLTYTLSGAIKALDFTDGDGDPVVALCRGSSLYLTAELEAGFEGAKYIFEQSDNGGNTWSPLATTTNPTYYVGTVNGALPPSRRYRVSLSDEPGYIGNPDEYRFADPSNLSVYPSIQPDDFTISSSATCPDEASGSVTIDDIDLGGLPSTTQVRIQLQPVSNGTITEPQTKRLNELPVVFSGLADGNYEVNITSINGDGGITVSNCTNSRTIRVGRKYAPRFRNAPEIQQPGCGESTATVLATRIGRRGEMNSFRLYDLGGTLIEENTPLLKPFYLFTGVAPGSYYVQIFNDDSGCSVDSEPFTINDPLGSGLGDVTVMPQGPDYDVACKGGETAVMFQAPDNGAYQVIVQKANPTQTPPQIFLNQEISAGNSFTESLAARDYTVIFRNLISGCEEQTDFSVSLNPDRMRRINVLGNTAPISCLPQTGSLQVEIIGGMPPYSFTVDGVSVPATEVTGTPNPTFDLSGLRAGTERLMVTDGLGCTLNRQYSIDSNIDLELSLTSGSEIFLNCFGDEDGIIELSASGGMAPYEFNITGNDSDYAAVTRYEGLSGGSYPCFVRDANGCVTSLLVSVVEPNQVQIIDVNIAPIYCTGNETTVDILIVGPQFCEGEIANNLDNAYNWSLDGGATYVAIDPEEINVNLTSEQECGDTVLLRLQLEVGDYDLSVRTYNNQCESATTWPIANSDFLRPISPLSASIVESSSSLCFGEDEGLITVNVQGGVAGYELQLVQFASIDPIPINPTVVAIAQLGLPGNYTFTELPPSLPGTGYGVQVKSTLKEDGSFFVEDCLVQLPGSWAAGENFAPIILTEPQELNITALDIQRLTDCDGTGGEILVSVEGGVSPYEYSNNGTVFTGPLVEATNWNTVTVQDANGCIDELSTSVSQIFPVPIDAELTILAPSSCDYDINVELMITEGEGPFIIEYSQVFADEFVDSRVINSIETNHVINGLEPGELFVEITDAAQCQQFFTFPIPDNAISPLSASVTSENETCLDEGDGSVTVTASGGLPPYRITMFANQTTESSLTVTELTDAEYVYAVRDAAGCEIEGIAVVVLEDSYINFNITTDPVNPCADSNNGSVTLTPTGGVGPYSLVWDDLGNPPITIFSGDSYTRPDLGREIEYDFELTDATGCTVASTSLPAGPDPFEVQVADIVQPVCADQATGSFSLEVLQDGELSEDTYQVSINGAPAVEQLLFTDLPAGSYTIEVFDENNCTYQDPLVIDLTNQVSLTADLTATDILCFGAASGTILVAADGGDGNYQYSIDSGNTFQTMPLFTDLPAGNYQVVVEDGNGCSLTTEEVIINEGLAPEATFIATDLSCFEAMDGTITAFPTVGTPPYMIRINGAPSVPGLTITGLAAGTYEATLSDANGCTVTSAILTINEPPLLTLTVANNQGPACNGDATGTISLSATGGTPDYEYRLVGQAFDTEATFSGLSTGTYAFEVRDANGCITSLDNVEVQGPPAIEITLVGSTPDFCDQSNGTTEVEATGGTGQLTYSWPNGDDTPMTTNLPAGSVTVTVTDENNCEATLEVLIGTVAPPTINVIAVTDAFCADDNGSISVEAIGGTPPYDFDWSNGVSEATLTNLSAGIYDLVLTDAANCTATISVNVAFVPPPTVLVGVEDATCGLANGRAEIGVVEGSGDYSYSWSDGLPPTAVANNLASGTYSYTVTDNVSGCTQSGDVFIGDTPAVQLVLDAVVPAPCFGETGSMAVTASGGTGGYIYTWSHDADLDAATATDLPAGTYTVTVTDEIGCEAILTEEVTEPPFLDINLLEVFASNCGEPTGQISVETSGGTPPYTYTWSHNAGLDSPLANNLLPGNYVVTVTDANACEAILGMPVENVNPPPVLVVEEIIPSFCQDGQGSADLRATGGNPPYAYTWSHDDFFNASSLNNLDAGDYTVTVTDESGCTDEVSFTVPLETPGPTAVIVVDETVSSCGQTDGSLTVEVIGGSPPYTYEWWPAEDVTGPTLSGVPPGEYFLTVYDQNNCRIDEVITVSGTPSVNLEVVEISAADCSAANGSITVVATDNQGAVTYTWSHDPALNAPTATDLGAGDYSVTATDAIGCTGVLASIVVDNNAAPTVATEVTDASCTDGNGVISLTISGGQLPYTYAWSHDALLTEETATELVAGTYSVTVTDANNCIAIINEEVVILTAPELTLTGITNSLCGAATATASVAVNGGQSPYTFAWSHDPTQTTANVSNLPAGQNFVTVTDGNDCSDILTIDISGTTGPTALMATANTATTCGLANGSLEVTPEGGQAPFTYNWSHDADLAGDTASDLPGGTYTVIATDVNGCAIEATYEVVASEALEIVVATQQAENCDQANGQIEVMVTGSTGALTYSWAHDDDIDAAIADNLTAGTYEVMVTDENNCTASLSLQVEETINPVLSLQDSQDATCTDGTGSLQFVAEEGVAPYQYNWSHDADLANSLASDLSAGSYTLTVTDAAGCSSTITESIALLPPPVLALLGTEETACAASTGSATVEVDGGEGPFTFSWSHQPGLNVATATDLAAGDYTVTVTDANECQSSVGLSVTTVAGPTGIALVEEVATTCGLGNGALTLSAVGGTAPYSYSWSHDAVLTGEFAGDLAAGTYEVLLTDANACTFSSSFTVAESLPIALELTEQLDANCGQADGSLSIAVANATGMVSYNWSHDTDLNAATATDLTEGSYSVLVTDENNCEATLDLVIENVPGPMLSLASVQDALCENGTGQLSVTAAGGTAPYTYAWSHDPVLASETAENLPDGMYTVMVTDVNGCTDELNEMIEWQSGPELIIQSLQSSTCSANNGGAVVMATGGTGPLIYSWAHDGALNTGELSSVPAGTYDLTVSDANNCTVETSVEVTDIPGPSAIVAEEQETTCGEDNGSLTVNLVGGTAPFDLVWSHDAGETGDALTDLSAGTYELTATDVNGCIIAETFVVAASAPLAVDIAQAVSPDCGVANGQIEVSVDNSSGGLNYAWAHDGDINSPTAANLLAGYYSVTVTDGLGCVSTESFALSNENAPVVDHLTAMPSLCEDGQGALSFTVEQGAPPYAYEWSHDPSLDSPSATALPAGNYVLTVTDAAGCVLVATGAVELIGAPELSIDVATYLCEADDLGALSLNISSGTAPYTVLWNTGADDLILTDLPAAEYVVTVTDNNSCESTATIDLALASTPSLSIQGNPPSCFDFSDGEVEVSAVGGSGMYSYAWSNGATSAELTGLLAGLYSVTVTDNITTCAESQTLDLPNPDVLEAGYLATPSCAGNTVGAVMVEVDGGVLPYNYTWSNGANSSLVEQLAVGTYGITVTDANDCETTLVAEVPEAPLPTFSIQDIQPTDCGGATGQVIITTDIPTAELELTWDVAPPNVEITEVAGQTQILANGLAADTYSFTLVGGNACAVADEVLIAEENPWEASISEVVAASCGDSSDGSATIEVTGAGMFSYEWDVAAGDQTTATAISLAGGIYTVTITDENDCTQEIEAVVTAPEVIEIILLDAQDPLCADGTGGSFRVGVSGGTPAYTYDWMDANLPDSPELENLTAGVYELSVTDAAGCNATFTAMLDAPPAIEISLELSNNPTCAGDNDGSLEALAQGGTGGLSYQWNDPDGQMSSTAANLAAGAYQVTVTDENACEQIAEFDLAEGVAVSITAAEIIQATCETAADGSISVEANGGAGPFSFAWSTGATGATIQDLAGGQSYSVTATNAEGCTDILEVDVPLGDGIELALPPDTTLCLDDLLILELEQYSSVTITGPAGFSSSEGRPFLEEAGTYSLSVADAFGCVAEQDITLNYTTQPLVAGMVLPSDVVVNDSVVVLETSWPAPEEVAWFFDPTVAELVKQLQNQYWFVFNTPGQYELGMQASAGGCEDYLLKTITVHADSTTIPGSNLGALKIENIVVSPNPNQGQFNVDVQLSNTAEVYLSLYNVDGLVQDRRQGENATDYSFAYDLPLQTGSYLLLVQTALERRTVVIVVQ